MTQADAQLAAQNFRIECPNQPISYSFDINDLADLAKTMGAKRMVFYFGLQNSKLVLLPIVRDSASVDILPAAGVELKNGLPCPTECGATLNFLNS
jgi:hypothetical protein